MSSRVLPKEMFPLPRISWAIFGLPLSHNATALLHRVSPKIAS